ncbi:aminotransferase class III-fold pyridoxal phosphate-dependent enzyme [Portibacter marinus]|uniref:aminotransferase class III-fold pyridoxal phosphate-dependent enzyme n=1 Tax=Portibacter marinus TaxID=2898660 RepID=UPI001F28FE2C|nr:aminotransferase class III-fold pyridoxal phosphate-dependent enzyme [Portibacter marinus]
MNNITPQQAESFASRHWRLQVSAKQLAGFEDQNFHLLTKSGEAFLLKCSAKSNHGFQSVLDQVYGHIGMPTKTKEENGQRWTLLPWTPGIPWADFRPRTPELYQDLGIKAARHYQTIATFSDDALHRHEFRWDLAQALWIKPLTGLLADDIKTIVDLFIERFEELMPMYDQFPKTTIHNDLNDYNILVKDGEVSGFIDYGDMCHSQRINELAILLTYGMMDQASPLDSGVHIVKGFSKIQELSREEILCLHTLIGMRLAVSLVTSAKNLQDQPENVYLQISRQPALKLIRRLAEKGEKWTNYRFLDAAGHQLFEENDLKNLLSYMKTAMVVPVQEGDYYTLDLTVGSTELGHEHYYNDAKEHQRRINHLLAIHQKTFAIGSYDEIRPLYSSDDFTEYGNEGQRWRTVHIGLDFFNEAGCEVYAFAHGRVHASKNNEGDKNYGNTVILEHKGFYTLYGHLSSATLENMQIGQEVTAGQLIGWLGEPHENGNWAPHLHFQIILDMLDYEDDFPGVCFMEEREVWKQISPDPRPFLGLEIKDNHSWTRAKIQQQRREKLGRSYSLSYDEPLHIVRAHGVYLYDSSGRKYLDCVNNVPHVGHQNIRVVEAASEQAQLLNTNTRYLHRNIVELADKLTRTLPNHLSVCHFVNSGSEANELAIRMARIATGRNGVVAMEHGYHGNTSLCVDISSYKFEGKGGQGQKDFVQIVPMPDPVRGSDGTKGFKLDEQMELPAAFIHESILSCGGQVVMPDGFYGSLYEDFRTKGMVMIADEVQTGLGRVGSHMWAFEAEGLRPDVVTIGKPFGNGHPLAAVVCTEEIADRFHNGMEYFNTFGGNPVSCAIGLEVLDIIEDSELQNHGWVLGQWITTELKEIAKQYPSIVDVRGRGLFLGWEFADPVTKSPLAHKASYFVNEMKRYGVLLSTDGPYHNVIKFKPPMVFTQSHAEYMLAMMKEVMPYI